MNFKYENARDTILMYSNSYEVANDIKTLDIKEVLKEEDVALWVGDKSDGTKTLFVLFRVSRRFKLWNFLAPSDNQLRFFKHILPEVYEQVDTNNTNVRGSTNNG